MAKFYYDTESGVIVNRQQLLEEFTELQNEYPDEYNYTFDLYIANCTGKNGFLTEV